MINITTQICVSSTQIADAITTAIEGGSNYWLHYFRLQTPNPGPTPAYLPWYANPKLYEHPFDIHVQPSEGDPSVTIDNTSIAKGLQLLADNHATYWRDLTGDDCLDADGADVLLQLICFQQVVYG